MSRQLNLTIDLYKENVVPIKLKQDDTTILNFTVTEHGVLKDLTGCNFELRLKKPDNTLVTQTSNINLSNGIVSIQLIEDCLRIAGESKAELRILKDNVIISTYVFTVIVLSSLANITPSGNVATLVNQLNEAISTGLVTKEQLDAWVGAHGDIVELDNRVQENTSQLADHTTKINKNTTSVGVNTVLVNKLLKDTAEQYNNSGMGAVYVETDNIYKKDIISLANTSTWGYYDNNVQMYPAVRMNKHGELIFTGNAKIKPPYSMDTTFTNMIKFGKLYHIDLSRFEGVPLRGTVLGVNDSDSNDMMLIPFMIKPDGTILLKNLGDNSVYYNRIDLSSMRVQTNGFGTDVINANIKSAVDTANAHDNAIKLLFFTDIHHNILNYRRLEQLKSMQKVCAECDIKMVLCGGDNINDTSTRESGIITHREVMTTFKKDQYIYAYGNHDLNILKNPDAYVRPSDIKKFINNSKVVYGAENSFYSYCDMDEYNLRIVVLDSHDSNGTPSAGAYVSSTQMNWLKTVALNLANKPNQKVIFMSHVPPTEQVDPQDTMIPNRADIRTMIENFKNGVGDFANQGARTVICYLHGHEHRDRVNIVNGINYVGNLLCWSQQVNYGEVNQPYTAFTREFGTDYEFCYDIMCIVDVERKVYFHRIGRKTTLGDRVISY